MVIARSFTVDLPASTAWTRVGVSPVQSITTVETVDAGGVVTVVAAGAYAIDLDASGGGWVRLLSPANVGRLRVSGTAGMAADQNGVPEPIRQGVLRLVAHLFMSRDGDDGAPPAAVTALWRPYRRMAAGMTEFAGTLSERVIIERPVSARTRWGCRSQVGDCVPMPGSVVLERCWGRERGAGIERHAAVPGDNPSARGIALDQRMQLERAIADGAAIARRSAALGTGSSCGARRCGSEGASGARGSAGAGHAEAAHRFGCEEWREAGAFVTTEDDAVVVTMRGLRAYSSRVTRNRPRIRSPLSKLSS